MITKAWQQLQDIVGFSPQGRGGIPCGSSFLVLTAVPFAGRTLCGLLGRALAAVRALEDFPAVFGALGALSGRPVNSNQGLRSMAAACPPKLPRGPSKGTNPDNDLSTRVVASRTDCGFLLRTASVSSVPTDASHTAREATVGQFTCRSSFPKAGVAG